MKEIGGTRSTLPNISLSSLNVSTRTGISQSSFNKFNKTMNQLNNANMIILNNQENKMKELPPPKEDQQEVLNCANEICSINFKEKYKKLPLSMINVGSNTISEYRYVPPRRPRYIHCLNKSILNTPQNLSKSLPAYKSNDRIFCKIQNSGSQSSNYELEEPTRINFVQFGDPSDCFSRAPSCYRTPALPLRMRIKIAAKEAESNMNQDNQIKSEDNEHQRAKSTSNYMNESNQINQDFSNDVSSNIISNDQSNNDLESFKNNQNPKKENVQCMSLKIFGESGDQIGCFSAKIPVHFPVDEKSKAKRALQISSIKAQPNVLNSSPASNQPKSRYSGF